MFRILLPVPRISPPNIIFLSDAALKLKVPLLYKSIYTSSTTEKLLSKITSLFLAMIFAVAPLSAVQIVPYWI